MTTENPSHTKETSNNSTNPEKKKCPCWQRLLKISKIKLCIAEGVLAPLALLAARVHMGNVFWKSGKAKWDDGSERTSQLFEWEYIPNWEKNSAKNIFGMDVTFPVPSPELGASMATYTEILMPIFLVLGFMGRGAAFILFGMAATIELFVYPGETEHVYWLLLLGLLITFGPGKLSFDHLIRRKFIGDTPKCCTICDTKTCETTQNTCAMTKSDNATPAHNEEKKEKPEME